MFVYSDCVLVVFSTPMVCIFLMMLLLLDAGKSTIGGQIM